MLAPIAIGQVGRLSGAELYLLPIGRAKRALAATTKAPLLGRIAASEDGKERAL